MDNKDKKIVGYNENGFPIYGDIGNSLGQVNSVKKNMFNLNVFLSLAFLILLTFLVIFSNNYFVNYAKHYDLDSKMFKRCLNVAHISIFAFVHLGIYYQVLLFMEVSRKQNNKIKYLLLNIIPIAVIVPLFFVWALNFIK